MTSIPNLKTARRLARVYAECTEALETYDAERRRPGTHWPTWATLSVTEAIRSAACVQAWRIATRFMPPEQRAAIGVTDEMDSRECGAVIMEAWRNGRIYDPEPDIAGCPKGRLRHHT
nr:hypothetical protein [uncultured Holophaga sp.]